VQPLYPCIALAIAGTVLALLCPLTDKRLAEITAETHEREESIDPVA
jgi:GPH family glycoside/pentoside/hexuronide:cation symporter